MSIEEKLRAKDDAARRAVLDAGYRGVDVVVMSQHQVREYFPDSGDEACISIGSERWGGRPTDLEGKFAAVLPLEFDDTGVADADDPAANTISDAQALRAVRFFADHLSSSRIVIHCFAGLSRSRSMAGALCLCFRLPFRYTILNDSVKRQIFKAFGTFVAESPERDPRVARRNQDEH